MQNLLLLNWVVQTVTTMCYRFNSIAVGGAKMSNITESKGLSCSHLHDQDHLSYFSLPFLPTRSHAAHLSFQHYSTLPLPSL